MQKKIVVALLCAMQLTCFGMNSDGTGNSSNEMQTHDLLKERYVKAKELLAVSKALDICLEIEKQNRGWFWNGEIPNVDCQKLINKFVDLEFEFHKELDPL